MFRKTAMIFGLALVTGAGFAADNPTAGMNIGINSDVPVNMQFDMLDRNGDGVISRIEAQASPELSALYDSFNTKETIEEEARKASVNGITRAQFSAGLEALGEGAIGPAVSGGGIYILMKDGTWVRRDKAIEKPVKSY